MKENQIIIIEKHPRILRYTHWINVVFLSLMVWSGVLIYWANDAYYKIPDPVAETLSIQYKLAEGLSWHFFIMWAFIINGLVYLAFLFISGEWRELAFDRKIFKDTFFVILHDLHIKKEAPSQKGKFNAAQKIAYIGAILMAFGSLITGIAIYKPVTMGWITNLLGGYEAARFEHFVLMIGFIIFVIVHILQVMRAGWNNFRAMIAGYEIEKK
ncbi:MAG: cytochrome b/b6 domain-containing protein [Bacteriovorax sp.]|nr:cytochrome b/b6 domain-containing protein [Bacteriovorax sp.]